MMLNSITSMMNIMQWDVSMTTNSHTPSHCPSTNTKRGKKELRGFKRSTSSLISTSLTITYIPKLTPNLS